MHYLSFIWAAMWPNIFAPGFWTIFGIGLSHWRMHKHVSAKHDELKEHVNSKHAELHEKLSDLKGDQ